MVDYLILTEKPNPVKLTPFTLRVSKGVQVFFSDLRAVAGIDEAIFF